MNKLRKTRTALATIFFILITLLLLDFTGTLHTWLGWMAKIQFLPALLAINVGVILMLAVLTLVVGRIYCSKCSLLLLLWLVLGQSWPYWLHTVPMVVWYKIFSNRFTL